METKYRELINKYLDGECSEGDLLELNHALDTSEEVRAEFVETKLMKASGSFAYFSDEKRIDRSFEELMARVGEDSSDAGKLRSTVPLFRKLLNYAAVLVGIITVGLGGYFLYQKTYATSEMLSAVATIEKMNIRLEDGTEITLDKNSTLQYPEHFEKNSRNIEIEGHAFMKVAKDKQRPFRVKAGEVYVQVLGTQFDIRTEKNISEVALIEGSVDIRDKQQKSLYRMRPGDFVSYHPKQKKLHYKRINSGLYLSWLKGEIDLNAVNFGELVEVLQRYYHKRMVVQSPELNKYELVVNLSLDIPVVTMMEALSNVAPISYRITNDSILISSKNRPR
ncbi:FecR domain-containing protein [Parabacteroides sp. FAFU027]|uniref:FecR domain-containing protein n=1 Tax=Parabacteroides sp. FAFU027 TaxID=2922715 RepID=UPI001FAEB6A4|nr:FecR domain-containing protein [Parabacteroides sp. FAFU027]